MGHILPLDAGLRPGEGWQDGMQARGSTHEQTVLSSHEHTLEAGMRLPAAASGCCTVQWVTLVVRQLGGTYNVLSLL